MKKLTSVILAVAMLVLALALASCGKKTYTDVEARTFALSGPTGMGIAKLMDEAANGKAALNYKFEIMTNPTQIVPEVVAGRFELAAVPVNLAATLLNKGADISLVAVNTLGVLYLIERGNTVNSVSDLAGKTVYATGQGSTPEYILRYLLNKAGIEDKVEIVFLSDGAEVASNLVAGKADIGFLPEPAVSSAMMQDKDGALRVALDISAEWNKVSDTPIVQGVIIASNTFIKEHGDALDAFLKEYKASTEYAVSNVKEAAALIEKYGILPKAAVAERALPKCNIVCYVGNEAKKAASDMMKVLFDANPASVGGKLPGDDFYYVK